MSAVVHGQSHAIVYALALALVLMQCSLPQASGFSTQLLARGTSIHGVLQQTASIVMTTSQAHRRKLFAGTMSSSACQGTNAFQPVSWGCDIDATPGYSKEWYKWQARSGSSLVKCAADCKQNARCTGMAVGHDSSNLNNQWCFLWLDGACSSIRTPSAKIGVGDAGKRTFQEYMFKPGCMMINSN